MENLKGRGPCYLKTEGISEEENESLKKAYLNMEDTDTYRTLVEEEKEMQLLEQKAEEYDRYLQNENSMFTTEDLEEAMQKVMDTYAGGISTHYQFNEKQLELAKQKILQLKELCNDIGATDMHELMFVYELKERLTVCLSVIAHLKARKETRWHSFAENLDYPGKSDAWLKYTNSVMDHGELKIIFRDLVGREDHEQGFYMPVQRVCRPDHTFRGFQGQIENGEIHVGDELTTLPSNEIAKVKSIYVGDKLSDKAEEGQPVTIQLDREVDVSRGCVLTVDSGIQVALSIKATLLWMDDEELRNGKNFLFKLGTKTIPGVVSLVTGILYKKRGTIQNPSPYICKTTRQVVLSRCYAANFAHIWGGGSIRATLRIR